MKYPFASPFISLPAYSAPMLVVVIMTTLETTQRRHAIHRHTLRPSLAAGRPADPELMKAPSVMREEMSCWRVVEMFQPIGAVGSSWP